MQDLEDNGQTRLVGMRSRVRGRATDIPEAEKTWQGCRKVAWCYLRR